MINIKIITKKFIINFLIIILLQLNFINITMAYETFYRNEQFKMAVDSENYFFSKIKPILDKRCVACHSCREAGCRLKLTSLEGIIRGAHTVQAFGHNLSSVQRTELFHDVNDSLEIKHWVSEWRKKGFYSVLENYSTKTDNKFDFDNNNLTPHSYRDSILLSVLKNRSTDIDENSQRLYEEGVQFCGRGFQDSNSVPGMPFNLASLNSEEYQTLYAWSEKLAIGAIQLDRTPKIQKTPKNIQIIKKWELFFNNKSNKGKWTSRYLYEHLFLARFYFKELPGEFYELVRSKTSYPEDIIVTPTLHAFDEPEYKNFTYRLRKVFSTIVDKNHFVYEVNDQVLKGLKSSFLETNWKNGEYVKFNFNNTNPLIAFKHIPARIRYQWMLENAHLLLDISARSQNCRSVSASAPYWDNMLHVFLKPEADPTVAYGEIFYNEAGAYLPIPNTSNGKLNPFDNFNDEQRNYAQIKMKYTKKLKPDGFSINDIWVGDEKANKNSMITVLRHEWTASAHQGQLGFMPRSVLLLDYANFERYFYLCNVSTEVSENMLGQSRVVTYLFDVRKEAENQFLSFIPENLRLNIRSSLVEGLDANYEYINDFTNVFNSKSGLNFVGLYHYNDYIKEFITQTFNQYLIGDRSFVFPTQNNQNEFLMSKMSVFSKNDKNPISMFPNVSYLLIKDDFGNTNFYTITSNRFFKSRVKLSFFNPNYEKSQRDPKRDYLEIYKGIFVNFPEKIYIINESEVEHFFDELSKIYSKNDFLNFNKKYGLDQNGPYFWSTMDQINSQYIQENPIHGGIIDLHRYGRIDHLTPL